VRDGSLEEGVELIQNGFSVELSEAVALARRVHHATHGSPLPSLSRIKLDAHGDVQLRDPSNTPSQSDQDAGSSEVVELAGLLQAVLLVGKDAARLPVRLRLIVARAVGHSFGRPDLPIDHHDFRRIRSTSELFHALDEFGPVDDHAALRALFARWERAHGLAPARTSEDPPGFNALTDLARLRASAGVSREAIAELTRIPLRLLADLERGDLSTWPRGVFARTYLRTYAQEAHVDARRLLALAAPQLRDDESTDEIRSVLDRPVSSTRKSQALRPPASSAVHIIDLASINPLPAPSNRDSRLAGSAESPPAETASLAVEAESDHARNRRLRRIAVATALVSAAATIVVLLMGVAGHYGRDSAPVRETPDPNRATVV
jgi:hypothetical protein